MLKLRWNLNPTERQIEATIQVLLGECLMCGDRVCFDPCCLELNELSELVLMNAEPNAGAKFQEITAHYAAETTAIVDRFLASEGIVVREGDWR